MEKNIEEISKSVMKERASIFQNKVEITNNYSGISGEI